MAKSSLVKSPSTTQVLKYEIKKVGSKVNANELIANKKSRDIKSKITKCYDKIAADFRAIATEYRNCATKSVKGDSICTKLKKVATDCENQAKYCENRKKNLNQLYTADKSELSVKNLEDSIIISEW